MNEKTLNELKNSIETNLRSLLEDTRKKCEKQMADQGLVNVVLMKVATENANGLKSQNENVNLILQALKMSKYKYDLLVDDITANVMSEYLNKPNSSINNSNKGSKKEGCYIATSIYGSYEASEVLVLRSFRDNYLERSIFGRLFIKMYYYISPTFVKLTKNKKSINIIIKKALDKFVFIIKNSK